MSSYWLWAAVRITYLAFIIPVYVLWPESYYKSLHLFAVLVPMYIVTCFAKVMLNSLILHSSPSCRGRSIYWLMLLFDGFTDLSHWHPKKLGKAGWPKCCGWPWLCELWFDPGARTRLTDGWRIECRWSERSWWCSGYDKDRALRHQCPRSSRGHLMLPASSWGIPRASERHPEASEGILKHSGGLPR